MQTRKIALACALVGAVCCSGSSVWGQETNTPLPAEKPPTAPVVESPLPKVELTFSNIGSKTWSGKRFSDIIPPKKIQRIIQISEHSRLQFGREGLAIQKARKQGDNDAFEATEQADYDFLIAHVVASPEKATEWGLDANEHTLAELIVLTTDDQLFRIEIVEKRAFGGTFGKDSYALLIYGPNNAARIKVSNSKFIKSRDDFPSVGIGGN